MNKIVTASKWNIKHNFAVPLMATLRTHDVMIFGETHNKLLQKCSEFYAEWGNYEVGIPNNVQKESPVGVL